MGIAVATPFIEKKSPELWLALQPEVVNLFVPDNQEGNSLKLHVKLDFRALASTQKQTLPPLPLPALQSSPFTADSFHFRLPLQLKPEAARKMIYGAVEGQEFLLKNYVVKIKAMEAETNGKFLLLKSDFEALKKGRKKPVVGKFEVMGIPKLNREKQTLFVDSVQFSLRSSKLVWGVGAKLFYNKIVKSLTDQAKIDVKKISDRLDERLTLLLQKNLPNAPSLRLNFQFQTFDLVQYCPDSDYIWLEVELQGKANFVVE